MRKIVINRCYGGFGISRKAAELLGCKIEKFDNPPGTDPGDEFNWYISEDFDRDDPRLVAVVETLGDEACGGHAELRVIEIPDDVKWHIEEYDGVEWIAEDHRTWR